MSESLKNLQGSSSVVVNSDLSNYVKTTGSQTVGGSKTFSSECYFRGGLRSDAFKTLYGTDLFTTIHNEGFAFTGIYTFKGYLATTPFLTTDGDNVDFRATTISLGGTDIKEIFAPISHTHTVADITDLEVTIDELSTKLNDLQTKYEELLATVQGTTTTES